MPFQEVLSPELQAQLDASMSLAEQLLQLPILSNVHHHIAMDALLILYSSYARAHTCCTASSVGALMDVARDLSTVVGNAPGGVAIH